MAELQLPHHGWLPNIKYVQIQTHSRCNADCVFCPYIESQHASVKGMMTDETWHLILANLRPFADGINKGKICPYLMQEPLIDKTIFSKTEDIYRCFPNTVVEISTNGAALNDSIIDKLFETFTPRPGQPRKHDLWVSHHGIDAATLEHIMKIPYDKAHKNLISLLKKSDGRFNIKIRGAGESFDGKHNFFTRPQYIEYWNNQFKEYGINTKNVHVDAFKFHDRAGTLYRTDRDACTLNMGTVREIGPGHKLFQCSRIDEWLHIMWDGRIRICCMDYHGEIVLPNIHEVSLLDYFHGPDYTELVKKVSGRIESEANFICKRCTSPGG